MSTAQPSTDRVGHRVIATIFVISFLLTACADAGDSTTLGAATVRAEELTVALAEILSDNPVGIARTINFGCVADIRDAGVEVQLELPGTPSNEIIRGGVATYLTEQGFGDMLFGAGEPPEVSIRASDEVLTAEIFAESGMTTIIVSTRGCLQK